MNRIIYCIYCIIKGCQPTVWELWVGLCVLSVAMFLTSDNGSYGFATNFSSPCDAFGFPRLGTHLQHVNHVDGHQIRPCNTSTREEPHQCRVHQS